ncbi:MAG: phage late control D family protein [Oscillospiraceae bacterium]|nr:phage late control D family protein [Oscillospiraceae bacterium]
MDKGQYTYLDLAKKYDNFAAPGFEITLAGSALANTAVTVPRLEVELTSDGNAGGCSFTIEGQWDPSTSKWKNGAAGLVELGKPIVIKGGYVSKKEIFYGYVDDYSMEFTEEGVPSISVTGLDGLGYLMSLREPIYAGKKKAKAVITEILNKSVSAGFAKKVKVGNVSGYETPLVKEQIDDWKFLNLLAQRYGASLFVVDGEMIFDTVMENSSPIITLTLGSGLEFFQKRVSLAHQVGKVEIWGRDVNQKPIKGVADSVSVGSGKSAKQLVSAMGKAVLREYSEFVRTQEECKTLAQKRLNGIAMGLVSGKGRCTGLPELIPGRYVKIAGGDSKSNGTYFISKVRHVFTQDGYNTEFEVKGGKA